MKETYGELILPKGFILYHTSDNPFKIDYEINFPMLFCVFHPSEWELLHVTKIILKKEINLFFAIDFNIRDESISIPICIMKEITKSDFFIRSVKSVKDYLLFFSNKLKENNFDGWVGLQKVNKNALEVSLINNPDIFNIKMEILNKDWKKEGMNYNKTIVIQKKWGNNFPIYFDKNIIININERYKYFIELFLQNIENNKYKYHKSLHLLLRDSKIIYNQNPINKIVWNIENLDDEKIIRTNRCFFK